MQGQIYGEPLQSRQLVEKMQTSLAELAVLQELEVRRLQQEVELLQDELENLRGRQSLASIQTTSSEASLGPLRVAAAPPLPPPSFPMECLEEESSRPLSPARPVLPEMLTRRGSEKTARVEKSCMLRFNIFEIHGLPGHLVRGIDLAEATCSVIVHSDLDEGETEEADLRLEQEGGDCDLPGQIDQEVTLQAEWSADGSDVCVRVPDDPLPEVIRIEVRISGTEHPAPCATLTLNAGRQQWVLDCGGYLDAEALVQRERVGKALFRGSTVRDRLVERLERQFAMRSSEGKMVRPRDLYMAVKQSRDHKSTQLSAILRMEDMEDVVLELKRIHQKVIDKVRKPMKVTSQYPSISWRQFMDCILLEDLTKHTQGQTALSLFIVQRALLGDEMPSTGTSSALLMAYEKVRRPIPIVQRIVSMAISLSTAAIILSFVLLGITLDNSPEWLGWIALDGVFAAIFVTEVVVKGTSLGMRGYFCGRDYWWNWFDVLLSVAAVSETILNLAMATQGSQTKAALILRGLRLARMARLAKLMRMPLLQELTNIISGFVISVRSLFWVMMTLFVVVYVLALGARVTVQALSTGEGDLTRCGRGDTYMLGEELPAGCKLHYLYGEEYCASVLDCMFSIFRCMIGECTSRGGRSLTMVFSDGFGLKFDFFYAFSMVVVIFGLFNIITAIFVQATMNGLRENEAHLRNAKAYESNYMTEQLAKLVRCVSQRVAKVRSRATSQPATATFGLDTPPRSPAAQIHDLGEGEIYLSEEEFNQLIRIPDVRQLLNELDVSVEPRPGVFDAFHVEEDGTVSMSELVSGLMRLRGDLHKVDLVIVQTALEHLQKQVTDVRSSQSKLLRRLPTKRHSFADP